MTKTHPPSSSLNSLGKRERPSNTHATSDYNMKTTIHEGRMWRWARSYDAPGMTPTPEMRDASQTPGFGGLAGRPGTTGPRNTRGWLAPARPGQKNTTQSLAPIIGSARLGIALRLRALIDSRAARWMMAARQKLPTKREPHLIGANCAD